MAAFQHSTSHPNTPITLKHIRVILTYSSSRGIEGSLVYAANSSITTPGQEISPIVEMTTPLR
jgi:hypothetical protein